VPRLTGSNQHVRLTGIDKLLFLFPAALAA